MHVIISRGWKGIPFLPGPDGKEPSCQFRKHKEMQVEDLLEEGIAIHSSILAWRIPQTEEPGRLQSMGSQRVRHD